MRILHSSDWHLGQTFHGYDRSFEHQCFLDWLLDVLIADRIDALLISGDVFDNANPSANAQRQLYQFLRRAKERTPHMQFVIIAGNHDSAGRLEAPRPLLEALDATVVGMVPKGSEGETELSRLLVPLKNREGQAAAWCLAIPFLRPGDVPRIAGAQDPYGEGVAQLYRQALALARERRGPEEAIIALGHCHMRDGQTSADSERRIVIGGAEALPAGMFDPDIAYVALGHLHLAQQVGQHAHIRYCGSPLPMSFAEVDYPHQVMRIELKGRDVIETMPIPIPRAVALMRIPAHPAPVEDVLALLTALELPQTEAEQMPYVEVRIKQDQPEPGLRARVEKALKDKPVRLAKIEVTRPGAMGHSVVFNEDEAARMEPLEVFRLLYRQKFGGEVPAMQLDAFNELLLASYQGEAA